METADTFDGTNIVPLNSPSLPIVLPPIYGLKGVGFETFTGDGPISYWNSYVGVGQMVARLGERVAPVVIKNQLAAGNLVKVAVRRVVGNVLFEENHLVPPARQLATQAAPNRSMAVAPR